MDVATPASPAIPAPLVGRAARATVVPSSPLPATDSLDPWLETLRALARRSSAGRRAWAIATRTERRNRLDR